MPSIALGPGKKRILILCGIDAPSITAANVYADLLRDHDLCFLEERFVTLERTLTFSRRRLRSNGVLSLLGSLVYYGGITVWPSKMPKKRYSPTRTVNDLNADPVIHDAIRNFQPDAVLVAFCSILTTDFLDLLPEATYNIHPGVNPRYRGFGNIWAAFENNFDCLGYTIHKIDAGLDTGQRIAVGKLSPRDLANVHFTDNEIPAASLAATHLVGLLLGTASASIPESFRDMPSRMYGVPTLSTYRTALKNFTVALKHAPRHILVTGASGGLGAALAEQYAAPGVHLTLWARDMAGLERIAALCRDKGAEATVISQDIRESEESRAVLTKLHADFPIDLAILNAGVPSSDLPDCAPESAMAPCRPLTANSKAAVAMAGTLFDLMRPRCAGHVVCISSGAAFSPLPDSPAYNAAKADLSCYAEEMRPLVHPVRVSVVHPGYADTPMSRRRSGPHPLRWTVDKAASHIRKRLEAGSDSIAFPLSPTVGARLLSILPAPVADFFTKRFGVSILPDIKE